MGSASPPQTAVHRLTESPLPIPAENRKATGKAARQEPDASEEVGIFSFN